MKTTDGLLPRLLSTALLLSTQLWAQPAKPPTLEAILRQLQANLDRYDASVPSFFADEHAVSEVSPGLPRENTVTDSVFRLKRILYADHTSALDESREVKTVNGRPATAQELNGPSIVSGAFEGGLAVVSLSQRTCMNYTLGHVKRGVPYIIHFSSVLTPENKSGCLLQEDGKGRVWIDPASMQITRMELTIPHHTIIPGDAYRASVAGPWTVAVGYAPVELGEQTFWMPNGIASRTTSGAGTFHAIDWSFRATYRNFHKLEVKSRILPANDTPPS